MEDIVSAHNTDRFSHLPSGVFHCIITCALLGSTVVQQGQLYAKLRIVSKTINKKITEVTETLNLKAELLSHGRLVLQPFPRLTSARIYSSARTDDSAIADHPLQSTVDIRNFSVLDNSKDSIQNLHFKSHLATPIRIWGFPCVLSFASRLRVLSLTSCDIHSTFTTDEQEQSTVVFNPHDFRHLKFLKMQNIRTMTALYMGNITTLRHLVLISNTHLKDVSLPVTGFLSKLQIDTHPVLTGICCKGLSCLTDASITNNGKLTSIDMSQCINLQHFHASDNTSLLSLSFEHCNNLSSVKLSHSQGVHDLDLQQSAVLEHIHVSSVGARTLRLAANMTKLKHVLMRDTQLTCTTFTSCACLVAVMLDHNKVMKTAFLSNNPNLDIISASFNEQVTYIDATRNSSLRSLHIEQHPALTNIRVDASPPIQSVILSNLPSFASSNMFYCLKKLKTLKLTDLPLLQGLDLCASTELSSLAMHKCPRISKVWLSSEGVEVIFKHCGNLNISVDAA